MKVLQCSLSSNIALRLPDKFDYTRRFSCAHAHTVNKMADVDTAAARMEKQQLFLSLSFAVNCFQ